MTREFKCRTRTEDAEIKTDIYNMACNNRWYLFRIPYDFAMYVTCIFSLH
jgi:hypothetical protein